MKRLVAFLLAIFGIAAGAFVFMFFRYSVTPKNQAQSTPVIIEVSKKSTLSEVAKTLAENGVIENETAFRWLGRLTRRGARLRQGEYSVSASLSPAQIFEILSSGKSIAHSLTITEGSNLYEIAAEIEEKGIGEKSRVIEICKNRAKLKEFGIDEPDAVSFEGFLFPDTYAYNKFSKPEELLHQMVRKALSLWGEKERLRAQEIGMSRYQVLTLASIIEKETGARSERPLISGVFHNRLRIRMRLQSDPTTIYGIWERYSGNLHRSDLLEATPYNTYAISALPIGPIGNPGRESIQAALYPAQTEALFFVSRNDGTHVFSKSLADHNRAVRDFQINSKAREGKSWRQLKPSEAARTH